MTLAQNTHKISIMPSSDFLCPVLWEDLAIKNDGDYRICCNFSKSVDHGVLKNTIGNNLNIHEHSFDQIRNHGIYKDSRLAFLRGQWPEGCEKCRVHEANGLASMRNYRIRRIQQEGGWEDFKGRVVSQTQTDGAIAKENFPIKEMDLRFGNLCNLRCRGCDPSSSSSWHGDYFQLGFREYADGGRILLSYEDGKDGRVKRRIDVYEERSGSDFFGNLPADLSAVSRIYFAGGEPLIDPRHRSFLRELIRRDLSRNIYLEYNTNLNTLTDEILDLWRGFKKIGVGVSLDGVHDHHEYFRYPSKFSRVEENLRKIDQGDFPIRAWISFTASFMNISNLPDTILWLNDQNFRNVGNGSNRPPVSVRFLFSPAHLNVQNIPLEGKKLIQSRLLYGYSEICRRSDFSDERRNSIKQLFDGLTAFMFDKDSSKDWAELWEMNKKLDRLRSQTFLALDPDLYSVLEGASRPEFMRNQKSSFADSTP